MVGLFVGIGSLVGFMFSADLWADRLLCPRGADLEAVVAAAAPDPDVANDGCDSGPGEVTDYYCVSAGGRTDVNAAVFGWAVAFGVCLGGAAAMITKATAR
jgi:hypothetical protein